jgi:hypothetical protein
MSIKTNFELPRASDANDTLKQGQRLAQDLSKNFKAIKKEIDEIVNGSANYTSGINGVLFSSAYSVTAGAVLQVGATSYTFTHNFGFVPSGFIITDLTSSNPAYMTPPVMTRDSWTTTQITVRISSVNLDIPSNLSRTVTGSFKIIVLR